MPLQIRDETANTLILTIDNSGLICFGNGTPVSAVTIGGTAVVNSQGLIINQRVNGATLVPTSGTVTCQPGQYVTVSTSSGVVPTVQIDSVWPAVSSFYHPPSSDDNGNETPAYCEYVSHYEFPVHQITDVSTSGFTVTNHDQADDLGMCIPAGHGNDATYRWF